jgi:hypothetical protein
MGGALFGIGLLAVCAGGFLFHARSIMGCCRDTPEGNEVTHRRYNRVLVAAIIFTTTGGGLMVLGRFVFRK